MKDVKRLMSGLVIVVMSWVVLTGVAGGATMLINFDNGDVVTYDTSKIVSITFSDSGASTGLMGKPSISQVEGMWSTTEGEMALRQNGNQVSGMYTANSGRIEATMRGNTMEGYWSQSTSGRACSSPRDGRSHWGRIIFQFDGNNSFTGNWGYCDDNPAHNWSGKRK